MIIFLSNKQEKYIFITVSVNNLKVIRQVNRLLSSKRIETSDFRNGRSHLLVCVYQVGFVKQSAGDFLI